MSENEIPKEDDLVEPAQTAEESVVPEASVPSTSADDVLEHIPEEEPAPEEPVYAGEYTPNPNVEEAFPVTEDLTEAELKNLARFGAVLLSNMELTEIVQLDRMVRAQVAKEQPKRKQMADDQGNIPGMVAYDMRQGRGVTRIWLSAAEAETMDLLSEYRRTIRNAGNYDLLTEGDFWTNLPKSNDSKIAMAMVDQSKQKDPLLAMRSRLGLSARHSVPMWASGMNIQLEGPGALQQLSLDTQLLLEKIEGGRDSNGYIYSASAVYLNRLVSDFLLKQVKSTTAGIVGVAELKKLILLTDLEPLALGGAATLFPEGYLLQRPCLTSRGGCGHVVERKVNLRRMLFVSTSKLSKDQLQLMSKRTGHVDSKTIMGYQEAVRPDISRLVPLKNGVSIRLRVPSLATYERIAGAWMTKMEHSSKELVASNASPEERQIYLDRAASVALLMAYAHWVDAFITTDPASPENDPEVVVQRLDDSDLKAQFEADREMDQQLEDLSGDAEISNLVAEAIEKFIGKMTIATAAVPKVRCPKCKKPVSGDDQSTHPHLVSVNPIELFFILLRRKIQNAGG